MKRLYFFALMSIFVSFNSGCASFRKASTEISANNKDLDSKELPNGSSSGSGGISGGEAFSGANQQDQVPKQLQPPLNYSSEQSPLDPVYVQSQADYYFTLAEAQSLEGHPKQAIELFQQVLVYDSKSVTPLLRIAVEYIKMGRVTEALEYAESAATANPRHKEAHALLGGLYASLKEYNKALKEYETILKIDPDNSDAPMYIGAIYAEQKEYTKAIKYFDSLSRNESYPLRYLVYYYLGKIRMEQEGIKYLKAAETNFLKALELKPDHVDSVIALGSVYIKMGKDEASRKVFEKFSKEQGPNLKISEILTELYLENEDLESAYSQLELLEQANEESLNVKVKMALILMEQKKYEKASVKLKEILRQVPESDKIRFYLAAVYEELKNIPEAMQNYQKIPDGSSFYSESIVHLAHLYRLEKDPDSALKTINEALEKRKDVPQFYALKASLLDEKKEYKKAELVLKEGLEAFPNNIQLTFFYATIQDRLGNKEQLASQMKKVLSLDPNHVQSLNYLAYTYAEMEVKLEEAEHLASRALKLLPQDGFVLDTYGWILYKKGDLDKALVFLEKAHTKEPNESIISQHLGDLYYKKQWMDKAKLMYEKARQNESDENKRSIIQSKINSFEKQKNKPLLTTDRIPASNP